MSPAADLDPRLLVLQGKVAALRVEHESLCQRHAVLEKTRHYASAQALRLRRDRTFAEFRQASEDLLKYVRNKEKRRAKT